MPNLRPIEFHSAGCRFFASHYAKGRRWPSGVVIVFRLWLRRHSIETDGECGGAIRRFEDGHGDADATTTTPATYTATAAAIKHVVLRLSAEEKQY